MYKYKQNDTVKIKESVSNHGTYAPYKGAVGKIISHNDNIANIRLDSGQILYSVGLSVIEPIDTNNKSETSKERLIKSLNEKREEMEAIQEKLKFLEETNQTQNKGEFIMEISVEVRVWLNGGRSEDTKIKITTEDIEELAEQKALERIEGLTASTIGIEFKNKIKVLEV